MIMCVVYPKQILPNEDFLNPLLIQELHDEQNGFIMSRRIDKPVSDCSFPSTQGRRQLDIDCLGENIERLSMNLMGGAFMTNHLIFQQKGEGAKPWKGGIIRIEDFVSCIVVLPCGFPLYYSSNCLHRRHFCTNLTFAKNEKGKYDSLRAAAKSLALTVFTGDEVKVDFESEIFIAHVPTNLNYWHVQMEVKPAFEKDDSYFKNGNSWREDVYVQLLTDILSFEFLEDVTPSVVASKYYIKGA